MSKKQKPYDYSYAVGQTYSCIIEKTQGLETYLEGTVTTRYGIAKVYSQGMDNIAHTSSLNIVKDGRAYTRTFQQRFTQRGLVMKVNQFVKELFEEKT